MHDTTSNVGAVRGALIGQHYAAEKCAVDRPSTSFEIAARTFEQTVVLVHRLETLADRLVGSVPENASKEGDPVSSGLFTSLAVSAEQTSRRIDSGFAAIERIERGLP